MKVWKLLLGLILLELAFLVWDISRVPEVKIKANSHISCDEYGQADIDRTPVDVELRVGYVDNPTLLVKIKANSWTQAGKICEHWNDIGYELEK